MSLYSKARRHIDMNRVKELREDKVRKKKIAQEVKEQIREELKNINNPEFSNWRFDLEEGMTSSGTFFTTLPAQGNIDLESIDAGTDTPSRIEDAEQVSSGTGTGKYDGFNLGKNYVLFNGADNTRYYAPPISDLTTYDTVTISIIAGNDTNGGTTPINDSYLYWVVDGEVIVSSLADLVNSKTADSLTTYTFTIPKEARGKNSQLVIGSVDYQAGQYENKTLSDFIPITTDYNTAYYINELLQYSSWSPTTTMRTLADGVWTYAQRVYLNDSSWFIGKSLPRGYPTPVNGYESAIDDDEREYIFNSLLTQFGSGVNRWPATYGIANVSYQRRTPVTVFVALDSPEATAFIRTDPMFAGLSPQERLKKLKEMLEASDEYVIKMLGDNFPGTGAVLPGEAGDTPGVELTDITSDAVDPGMGMGDQAIAPAAAALLANPIGQAALAAGAVAVASLLGITLQKAQEIIQQVNAMGGGYTSDPYGQDQAGPTTTGQSDAKELTPQQQAEVEKAGKELRDARRALDDLPADATDTQRDMAQERLDRATKNRQRVRKKHREENKNRRESFESNGEVLIEKKKLKSVKDITSKIPGYYDGKPAPLGFPVEPPPKMVNGMHPDLVDGKKVADRFNRLDPESAKAMPPTGNPHIDKKVRAAAKKPK